MLSEKATQLLLETDDGIERSANVPSHRNAHSHIALTWNIVALIKQKSHDNLYANEGVSLMSVPSTTTTVTAASPGGDGDDEDSVADIVVRFCCGVGSGGGELLHSEYETVPSLAIGLIGGQGLFVVAF